MTTVAVIAPGQMGSAVARRLTQAGARVLTVLDGRSAESRARAADCGMENADLPAIAAADLILSIVPPGEAVGLAQRLAPTLHAATPKAVYVDCNAVSPRTMQRIAAIIRPTGANLVDAGIVGPPPKEGRRTAIYFAGDGDLSTVAALSRFGLTMRHLEGPVGTASALKLSYAGLTKGTTALYAAMLLGATRGGSAAALRSELAESQPDMLTRAAQVLPDMLPKAYRWVAEMREIADFLGPDDPAAMIYEGMARLYESIAADVADPRADVAALERFIVQG